MDIVIENDCLVIRLPLDYMVCATENCPALTPYNETTGEFGKVKITDKEQWAKEVIYALNDEEEDGTTLVHEMFDQAFVSAVDQGAQGIWIEGVLE